MKRIVAIAFMSSLLVTSAFAQKAGHPKHPNLARAHHQLEQAIGSITAAQKANEFDLGGHAAKAKELLEQANGELKQAVEAANDNKKH